MKRIQNKTTILTFILTAAFLISALTVTLAQEKEIISKYKYAVENLKYAIQSDNEGLKRSSIYFAGKYKITGAVNSLTQQLENEDNPSDRILIALVLYKIGSPEGIDAVKHLSKKDKNQNVRRMAIEIYNAYMIDKDGGMKFSVNNFN